MHQKYMRLAIEEAKKGSGKTYTNPLVGAVIVHNQQVIAKGAHLEYGQHHAERNAIEQCQSSEELINSILYVTLEPCNHFGKQPPCSQLIIDSGIRTVVVGQLDPNPLVAGQGKAYLEKKGIEVIVGVEEERVRQLNPAYNFFYQHQRPYITLKHAVTLDGRIALNSTKRLAITGSAVWQIVHEERGNYQAILVGSQTILTDNPSLMTTKKSLFPPIRVVLDRRGRTLDQKEFALFQQVEAPVWIFTERKAFSKVPDHVTVIVLPKMSISEVVKELAMRNVQSVYVEGGAQIHDAFLAEGYWEELITYLSPQLIGGSSLPSFASERVAETLTTLEQVVIEPVGVDFRISGRRKILCSPD